MSAPLLAPCTCVSDCGDCPGVQHGLRKPCAIYIASENKRRLHDAGPELLQALRVLLDRTGCDYYPAEQEMARAAIAKATGSAP